MILGYDSDTFIISGFGVVTTKAFPSGSFILEYVGERISVQEAEKREKKTDGLCYMFYFKYGEKRQW